MKTYDLAFLENPKPVVSKDLKYTLSTLELLFSGASSRGILIYAGVDWTPIYPDWPKEKPNQPFDLLPVVTVADKGEREAGRTFVLAENLAVDIFLAKHFGLHGNDEWEEGVINSFYSSSNAFFFQEIINNLYFGSANSAEEKTAKLDTFLNKTLAGWADIHEAHLKNNHLNGHYVGNRTTLADIRTTTMLEMLTRVIGVDRVKSVINETRTPGIHKVITAVQSKPSYAAWFSSDAYKNLDSKTTAFVKNDHPEFFLE
ncbi:hypothetical protein BGZ99_003145 [Dissophora globulifera]|uniref:GST C-terminal domain-containing protein n=1 Tax=Dissophora globulifera TaxID=979702 RepID=A0A9P6QUV0_9FUNG|nr:hypothetical protein BGZ99_003145 [Dissophora globulifera]